MSHPIPTMWQCDEKVGSWILVYFLQIWYIFKRVLENIETQQLFQYFHPILHWGWGAGKQKMSVKQKLLMVKAFNKNFSVSKTQFCTEFSKIRHSILWKFLLSKLPKEIKDAKGKISMHYKNSVTVIRFDLMS